MTNLQEEVLTFINTYIEDTDEGKAIGLDDKICESGVDSFSMVEIVLEIDEEFECYPQEYMEGNKFPYTELTPAMVAERVKYVREQL